MFRVLADAVVLVHFFFILFVIFGGLLVMQWRWLIYLHLPAAIWGAAIEFAGWICPLTPLENSLRRRAGHEGYEGGFVDHYIVSLIYPEGLTPRMQLALGVAVILVNAVIYWRVFRKW